MTPSAAACVFCDRSQLDLLGENGLAFAIRDKYPVRHLHSLVLPKRHVADSFELSPEEVHAIFELGRVVRDQIVKEDPQVGGFNFGSNNGPIAGQKIMHVHSLDPAPPGRGGSACCEVRRTP